MAIDRSHLSFHVSPKSSVTFKTIASHNSLSGRRTLKPLAPGAQLALAPRLARPSNSVSRSASQGAHALKSATVSKIVRARVEHEVERLVAARSGHVKTAHQQLEDRAGEFTEIDATLNAVSIRQLCHELVEEFSHVELRKSVPHVANSNAQVANGVGEARAAAARSDVRALHALRLIEKIDVFVKSQRPALALTLNSVLAARVEIERVGAHQVALRITGHRGPPSPETITRIREEMKAKGLKIAVLQVA